ncbi:MULTISPECIES: PepSY domain-containing protein [unclassified Duganella]|uniref:PepSY-associated TM helix domain-containing protein n=1 Tax=unclassified Duganella TaxID=2636909 RepID=UPI000880F6E1|nr:MULTISPECIES: PepSY-associated TM helix domain-containing protein [unclassified Duganella]SDG84362.1 Uncharacterized iron-regulated membrane protein [Duganella sp. OV458]SDK11780.1 Uncharacterized iron-regulated membrane protein [Duganella sp. OV510]
MRAEIIRTYKSVHTWTGIVCGFVLFIAFYAGALTMFEETLSRWPSSPSRPAMAPLQHSQQLIADTLATRPDARKEFTLHLRDDEQIPARITWTKGRGDRQPWTADYASDGSLRVEQARPSGMAQFIDHLHRTGGLPGNAEVTEFIMGLVSLAYAVALVSGTIVLLPSLLKDFFALRVGKNLKRMWLDAHNVIGIASLPFHIVIALSAMVFGLHDQIYDLQEKLVYNGNMAQIMKASSPNNAVKPDQRPAPMLAPQELLARVRDFAPDFEPLAMQYRAPGTAGATVRIAGNDPRYMIRREGFLLISPVSGKIVDTTYFPGKQSTWTAPVSAAFALHFGTFGGEPVRWMYFAMGLGGAILFYTGNLLWVETRRKNARGGEPVLQRRAAYWLSAATVGVCIGSIAGISAVIAAAKLMPGDWHLALYYAVFLLCCGWAFWRGAAMAGAELLWLAAITTLAIPATTLWHALQGAAWQHAYGIDAGAVIGALVLAVLARAARRRQQRGIKDSVWSPAATAAAMPVAQPR